MKKLHAYLLFPALLLFYACSSNTSQSVNQSTGVSASSTPIAEQSAPPPPPDPWASAKLVGSITYAQDGSKVDTSSISQIRFSPDGTVLASRVFEDKIRLWDLQSGERKFTLNNSRTDLGNKAYAVSSSFQDFSFSSDSKLIVFFSWEHLS
jgi:WD40 repeat protein